METRYYFVYNQSIFVGYIRISETNVIKNVSVVKTTTQQMANNISQLLWNVPELHYQYPLIHTFDNVAHDALQQAYAGEGFENYTTEYFQYL